MRQNPTVNRYLNDKDMDRIDHALGRPIWPLRETYRNHYATDIRSDIAAAFEASPHWELNGVDASAMAYFSVTDAGRQALVNHLAALPEAYQPFEVTYDGYVSIVPAKSRSAAKYALYLQVSDCFAELQFGDFAKASTVRRAA